MNTCFDKNKGFRSNNRIYEAYFTEAAKPVGTLRKVQDLLLCLLSALVQILTASRTRRIVKVGAVTLSLIGFVGVIGAIERGSLGLGAGLLIGAILLGIEYLCLRGRHS